MEAGLSGLPPELPELAAILSPAYRRHQIDALFRAGASPFDVADASNCVDRLLAVIRVQIA